VDLDIAVENMPSPLALPKSRRPTGWFQVAWSDEISIGSVKAVRAFGQDYVLWRGESGTMYAMDAHCRHLGANIGVGGSVWGDEVACPFHGWRWNGEGENTLIPHSSQTCKPGVTMRTHEVEEWYGIVMMWHDVLGRPPLWPMAPIEEMEDESRHPFGPTMRGSWTIRAHPQLPIENGPDLFHVNFVHKGEAAEIVRYDFDEWAIHEEFAVTYGKGKPSTWLTPNGAVRMVLKSEIHGIGHTTIVWPEAFLGGVSVTNITPVDDEWSVYSFAMTGLRSADEKLLRRAVDHQLETVQQDFPIWENMAYQARPNFAVEEGKNYAGLRRWVWRFYPEEQQPTEDGPT
jgi:phenylpropionate dioxygenase-like ring-hydroxylating dioxygenase large terminal subunit